MVTKAKPRGRRVSLSITRATSVTGPCWEKASWRSFSVTSKERLPTYNFVLIKFVQPASCLKPGGTIGREIGNASFYAVRARVNARAKRCWLRGTGVIATQTPDAEKNSRENGYSLIASVLTVLT